MQVLLRKTPGRFSKLSGVHPTLKTLIHPRRMYCALSSIPPYHQFLTPEQQTLLNDEVSVLNQLQNVLEKVKAAPEDLEALQASVDQLQHLFLLVVVGEFNSGKSSFLNALLGRKFLDDGVTPTTSRIDIIQHSDKVHFEDVPADAIQRHVGLPVPWLKDINLVDTPGTNAIFRFHQTLTEHFVPRSDLVLWVTSADRAFSESERLFLEQVEQFQKKVVVIISKVDILMGDEDLKQIESFVKTNFKQLAGVDAVIFPVSSKLALEAKTESSKVLSKHPKWIASRFPALEKYIFETLSAKERAYLKFKNPVGVADHLLSKYFTEVQARLDLLKQDLLILQRIEEELDDFKADLMKNFNYHLDRVDNVLFRLQERGEDFFDTRISLSNAWSLMDTESIKAEFERDVVGKASAEIDEHVGDVVDWLIKKNAKQWANTTEYILARAKAKSDFSGKISQQFDYDRSKVLGDLGDSARKVVSDFDQKKAAEYLSSSIRAGVYKTAVVEVSAGGIAFLSASLLDISGVFPAAIAVAGLGVLPYVRYTLKTNLNKQIVSLRQRMKETLSVHFQKQLNEGLAAIRENIAPYQRFIVHQEEAVKQSSVELKATKEKLDTLRTQIDARFTE